MKLGGDRTFAVARERCHRAQRIREWKDCIDFSSDRDRDGEDLLQYNHRPFGKSHVFKSVHTASFCEQGRQNNQTVSEQVIQSKFSPS